MYDSRAGNYGDANVQWQRIDDSLVVSVNSGRVVSCPATSEMLPHIVAILSAELGRLISKNLPVPDEQKDGSG